MILVRIFTVYNKTKSYRIMCHYFMFLALSVV